MDCKSDKTTFIIISIILLLAIVLLSIFLGLSYYGTNRSINQLSDITGILSSQTAKTRTFLDTKISQVQDRLQNINSITAKETTLLSNQTEIQNRLSQIQQQTNSLQQSLQGDVKTLLQNQQSIAQTQQSILDRPITVPETNIFVEEQIESILSSPIQSQKEHRVLYYLNPDSCHGKKDLSGTQLERVDIPQLRNSNIFAFVEYPDSDLLIVHDPSSISKISKHGKKWKVKWTSTLPVLLNDIININNKYYALGLDKNIYVMNFNKDTLDSISNINIGYPVSYFTVSPDNRIFAVRNHDSGITTIYTVNGDNFVMLQQVDYPVIALSPNINDTYDIITIDEKKNLVYLGKERLSLQEQKMAVFTDDGNIFGLQDVQVKNFDGIKSCKKGIYLLSRPKYNHSELVL